jgi:hypothetical protein
MPKNGSMGVSENTHLKQEHFTVVMNTHMAIVRSIMQRKAWVDPHYVYIDLNAGAGRYTDERGTPITGSPLRTLAIADRLALPLWGCLCESNRRTAAALQGALTAWGLEEQGGTLRRGATAMWIAPASYLEGVPHFLDACLPPTTRRKAPYYGMIYSDENGAIPPFALLGECARRLPYCDLLIHVAATTIKRQRYSPAHPLMLRLDELMATVPKTTWVVREPYTHQHWTFLIGTNWDSFPRFRKQGFWPVSSPEGASILRRLSRNQEEYSGQGSLFAP